MVMPILYDSFKIEDIVIKDYTVEKKPNGKIYIVGNCKVKTDDFDEDFMMDFTYEGKSNESNSKLLEYLKELGWKENKKRNYKKPQTLIEFVTENIK